MGKERREDIVMLPFMAQGHIIPFLGLAVEIERRYEYRITLINTPQNIKKLESRVPSNSSIVLRSIPYNSVAHGLPPKTENSDGLSYDLIFRLMQSSFALEPHLRTLLQQLIDDGCRPLCIITDMFFSWVGRVAHELGIFHAIFAATSGFGMACYYSLWSSAPHWKLQGGLEEEFEMEDFPEGGKVHITQMPPSMAAADGHDSWSLFQRKMLGEWFHADALLFNDVQELDPLGFAYFRRKIGLPVWGIGPVLNQDRGDLDAAFTLAWLHTKPPRSVVYVCFGSQNTLTSSSITEMAKALEESGRFFIWVVRPPLGETKPGEEWLPQGFVDRVEGRGLIVSRWAPQMEILSHGSTGAFISHCGWNSILEAIGYGVPIISWPMAGEQFFNVKFLDTQLGICVELGRGNACQVSCEDIVRKIERVMGDEQGAEELRGRASKVMNIISDAKRGSSLTAMDDFFSTAIARRQEQEEANSEVGATCSNMLS